MVTRNHRRSFTGTQSAAHIAQRSTAAGSRSRSRHQVEEGTETATETSAGAGTEAGAGGAGEEKEKEKENQARRGALDQTQHHSAIHSPGLARVSQVLPGVPRAAARIFPRCASCNRHAGRRKG